MTTACREKINAGEFVSKLYNRHYGDSSSRNVMEKDYPLQLTGVRAILMHASFYIAENLNIYL